MEFGQVLRRRRMIRSYDEARPVPSQAIDAVLAAALRAPSAGFTQGVSLLVLTEATDREAFWQLDRGGGQRLAARHAECAGPDLGLDQRGGLP